MNRHATHDEKELLLTALAKENKYYFEQTKEIKEMNKERFKKWNVGRIEKWRQIYGN